MNLKTVVTDMQAMVIYLCDAERKVYAQKAKCEFLPQRDKSTKLFHSLVMRNAQRNYIASLTKKMELLLL